MPNTTKRYKHKHIDMKRSKWVGLKKGGLVVCFFALTFSTTVFSAENTQELKLPDDLAEKAATTTPPKYTIEERRIGSRLDQITVQRENGIDEIYDNSNGNSLWQTEDDELGETQNLRRWTIGSW